MFLFLLYLCSLVGSFHITVSLCGGRWCSFSCHSVTESGHTSQLASAVSERAHTADRRVETVNIEDRRVETVNVEDRRVETVNIEDRSTYG